MFTIQFTPHFKEPYLRLGNRIEDWIKDLYSYAFTNPIFILWLENVDINSKIFTNFNCQTATYFPFNNVKGMNDFTSKEYPLFKDNLNVNHFDFSHLKNYHKLNVRFIKGNYVKVIINFNVK